MPLGLTDPSLPPELAPILEILIAAYPREGCGVVLRGPSGHRVVSLTNAVHPELAANHFAFPDEAWLRVLLDADRSGERVTCVFHAHVGAPADFSAEDRRAALGDDAPLLPGVSYLVVSLGERGPLEARLYRWNGVIFDEVARSKTHE